MKSIRGKILLVMGLSVFLVLAGLGAVLYNDLQGTIRPITERIASEVVQGSADQMGQWLAMHQRSLEVLAGDNRLTTLDDRTRRTFIASPELPVHDQMEMLFFADRNGDFYTSLGQEGNISHRDYYAGIIQQGQDSFVSEPVVSASTGEPIVVLAQAIHSPQGELIGLLGATLTLDYLTERAGRVQLEETGFGYIVDGSGLYIAHRDPELTMQSTVAAEQGANAQLAQLIARDRSGLAFDETEQGRILSAAAPIPFSPGWYFVVSVPVSEMMAGVQGVNQRLWMFMSFALLLVLAASFLMTRWVTTPIQQMETALESLAQGHLNLQLAVNRKDEFGRMAELFNTAVKNVRALVMGVEESAAATVQSSQTLSASSQENSASIEEVAATIGDFTNNFQSMNRAVKDIAQQSQGIDRLADGGGQRMTNLETSVRGIADASQESVTAIRTVGDAAQSITKMVDLISSVAEQTNMLALNAAIEAARAGEHGRGFSVVADEVRGLAEQSQKAVGEIQRTIQNLLSQTQQAQTIIEGSRDAVEKGRELAKDTQADFDAIKQGIATMIPLIQGVEQSSDEMQGGAESISATSEQQAASMQEVARAAQSLSALAEDLEDRLKKFSTI